MNSYKVHKNVLFTVLFIFAIFQGVLGGFITGRGNPLGLIFFITGAYLVHILIVEE